MTRSVDVSTVDGLIRGAFASGAVSTYRVGREGGVSVDADMFGRCENPIEISRTAVTRNRVTGEAEVRISSDTERHTVNAKLRCRKCWTCLRARGKYWREAAQREMLKSITVGARNWFGTLTLSPEHQAEATYAAQCAVGMDAFAKLTELERLPLRHHAVSKALTLALKRLRKELGAGAVRYLIVCEAHKSGLPHYHMLLHECSQKTPIRKSSLNDFWRLGFSQWRLAKPEACAYVAKYLSKAALARVRASQHYGSQVHLSSLTPVLGPDQNQMPLPFQLFEEKSEGMGEMCSPRDASW